MTRPFAGAFPCLLLSMATSQSLTCTRLTDGHVYAVHAGVAVSEPVPAGVTATMDHHGVQLGSPWVVGRASVTWHVTSAPAELRFSLMHQLMSGAGSLAAASPGELLLEVTAPPTMPVQLVMWRQFSFVAGMPMPTVAVDVGDNGSLEMDSTTPAGIEVAVWLPAGTSRVRVRAQASLGTSGMAAHTLNVCVRPAHASVSDLGFGCDPPGLVVVPRFSGEIVLAHDGQATWVPWLVVLGAGLSPQSLPGPWPLCLLLPTPDAVLFVPGALQHTLVIPPALRPLTFYVQGVRLSSLGPSSGSGFRVDAF